MWWGFPISLKSLILFFILSNSLISVFLWKTSLHLPPNICHCWLLPQTLWKMPAQSSPDTSPGSSLKAFSLYFLTSLSVHLGPLLNSSLVLYSMLLPYHPFQHFLCSSLLPHIYSLSSNSEVSSISFISAWEGGFLWEHDWDLNKGWDKVFGILKLLLDLQRHCGWGEAACILRWLRYLELGGC